MSVNPDGTPGHVAADELIESAWGNAVSDSITKLKLPNNIAGTVDALGMLRVETAQASGALDAGGNVLITYAGGPFDYLYTLVAVNTRFPEPVAITVTSFTAANFTLNVKLLATGGNNSNGGYTINYIAIGRRT